MHLIPVHSKVADRRYQEGARFRGFLGFDWSCALILDQLLHSRVSLSSLIMRFHVGHLVGWAMNEGGLASHGDSRLYGMTVFFNV